MQRGRQRLTHATLINIQPKPTNPAKTPLFRLYNAYVLRISMTKKTDTVGHLIKMRSGIGVMSILTYCRLQFASPRTEMLYNMYISCYSIYQIMLSDAIELNSPVNWL